MPWFLYSLPSNGAQLWQGGKDDIDDARRLGVTALSLAALQWQPPEVDGMTCTRAPLRDSGSLDHEELEWTKTKARELADWLYERMLEGRHVMSSCVSGLNRSGLVSGLILLRATNWTPDEVIGFLREKRSPHALNNDLFVRIIKGEA